MTCFYTLEHYYWAEGKTPSEIEEALEQQLGWGGNDCAVVEIRYSDGGTFVELEAPSGMPHKEVLASLYKVRPRSGDEK